jgi:transposase
VIPAGVEIFVALAPINLRWSFDRLASLVEAELGRSARAGALFVFFGKRRTALKILFFDGSGLCLFYKRLDRNLFALPEPVAGDERCVEVPSHVLDELLDGLRVEIRGRRGRRRAIPEKPPLKKLH